MNRLTVAYRALEFVVVSALFVLPGAAYTLSQSSDTLYSAAYGNTSNPAVVFFHGGPGYNSFTFENAMAERLSQAGYYVIVWDQRGCGRSSKYTPKSGYAFDALFEDVDDVMTKYHIDKAHFIGHSWGGTLATKYARTYPKRVQSLMLVGSPLSYQRTFGHIRHVMDSIYAGANLKLPENSSYATMHSADTTSMIYASACFGLAMKHGFYSTPAQTSASAEFSSRIKTHPNVSLMSNMTIGPTLGIYMAERYTILDMTKDWKTLAKMMPIRCMIGMHDGLFDQSHTNAIRSVIGKQQVYIVPEASHNIFINNPDEFIRIIESSITSK